MISNLNITAIDQTDLEFYLNNGKLPNPGEVKTDALTFAMLGALKSRSADGLEEDLKKVKEKGTKHFIETYYKKYGHASIGQNSGIVGIYIEGCSMLAAKAIQDLVFYNGQECSTRYIDFNDNVFIEPTLDKEDECAEKAIKNITAGTKKMYAVALEAMQKKLHKAIRQCPELIRDKSDKQIENVVNAKAFDICRSILPGGARTMVAWHGLIETIGYRIEELLAHELKEVRDIAYDIHQLMCTKYPDAFADINWEKVEFLKEEREQRHIMETNLHSVDSHGLDTSGLRDGALCQLALSPKFRHTRLSNLFKLYGTVKWDMTIDYGSWRDLQRHREIYASEPKLTTRFGFEDWYYDHLESVPGFTDWVKDVRQVAYELGRSESIHNDQIQYIVPMGFKVQASIVCTLPQLVYIGELRSGHTVHPTARAEVLRMIDSLVEETRRDLNDAEIHVNFRKFHQFNFTTAEPALFYMKRGDQNFDEVLKEVDSKAKSVLPEIQPTPYSLGA